MTTTSLEAWPTGRVRRSIRLPERVLDPEFVRSCSSPPINRAQNDANRWVLAVPSLESWFSHRNWSDLICLYLFSHWHWKIMSFHSSSVIEVLRDGCSLPPSIIINPRSPSQDIQGAPRSAKLLGSTATCWSQRDRLLLVEDQILRFPMIPNDSQVSLGPRGIYHCLMTHWIMGKTRFLILWISRHSPSLDRPSGAVKPTSKGKKQRTDPEMTRKETQPSSAGWYATNMHQLSSYHKSHIIFTIIYIYMWSIYIWLYTI